MTTYAREVWTTTKIVYKLERPVYCDDFMKVFGIVKGEVKTREAMARGVPADSITSIPDDSITIDADDEHITFTFTSREQVKVQ